MTRTHVHYLCNYVLKLGTSEETKKKTKGLNDYLLSGGNETLSLMNNAGVHYGQGCRRTKATN
jgi:hypothetical protein